MVIYGNEITLAQGIDTKIFSGTEPLRIGAINGGKEIIISQFGTGDKITGKPLIAPGQRISDQHIGSNIVEFQKRTQSETAAESISVRTAVRHDQHAPGAEKFIGDFIEHGVTLRR